MVILVARLELVGVFLTIALLILCAIFLNYKKMAEVDDTAA